MLGQEYVLKMELLKTISSSTQKKKKGKGGGNFDCVLRYEKKGWEIKIESEFWIHNYGNGKSLMGRDSQRIALSYVFQWSRGIIAGI